MLNEHVGVVLKDVVDGKGKRLEINVRTVLAAEFQIILEDREVHAGLDVAVNINVENVSRHRSGKIETYNRERLDRPLALDERDSPHARRSRWSSLGRTTLTAATGEYNEESERRWPQHHHSRKSGAAVSSLIIFWGQRNSRLTHFYAIRRPRKQPKRGGRSPLMCVDMHTRILGRWVYNLAICCVPPITLRPPLIILGR
jgi:hypothetical protein